MNNFYFSQFHEHILGSSRLQMLFKVAALKDSQYFELKRDSNRGVFYVNIANFSTTAFFRTPPVAAFAFLIKQLFCKGI